METSDDASRLVFEGVYQESRKRYGSLSSMGVLP